MPSDPILEVAGAGKSYGDAVVLDDVSFAVQRGSIVTLAGSNGSGKSTLLRCIAGLASYRGSITVGGVPANGSDAHRRALGYLPQAVAMAPNATVGEAIEFFAKLRGADLRRLPLPKGFLRAGSTRIGTLSGGQKQRVAIAVALLGDPPLLLLDEPVANLDEDGRADFWEVLRKLREGGTTALIASPSPSDLAGIGDGALVLKGGRLVQDTQVDVCGRNPEVPVDECELADGCEVCG